MLPRPGIICCDGCINTPNMTATVLLNTPPLHNIESLDVNRSI
jgi:hypothetical protein